MTDETCSEIPQPRRLYTVILSVIGWGLMVLWLVYMILTVYAHYTGRLKPTMGMNLYNFGMSIQYLLLAFMMFGISDLLQCFQNLTCYPGWALRHAHQILYVFGFLMLGKMILSYGNAWFDMAGESLGSRLVDLLFGIAPSPLFELAKVLAAFGVGYAIQCLLPVIEESKTLA